MTMTMSVEEGRELATAIVGGDRDALDRFYQSFHDQLVNRADAWIRRETFPQSMGSGEDLLHRFFEQKVLGAKAVTFFGRVIENHEELERWVTKCFKNFLIDQFKSKQNAKRDVQPTGTDREGQHNPAVPSEESRQRLLERAQKQTETLCGIITADRPPPYLFVLLINERIRVAETFSRILADHGEGAFGKCSASEYAEHVLPWSEAISRALVPGTNKSNAQLWKEYCDARATGPSRGYDIAANLLGVPTTHWHQWAHRGRVRIIKALGSTKVCRLFPKWPEVNRAEVPS